MCSCNDTIATGLATQFIPKDLDTRSMNTLISVQNHEWLPEALKPRTWKPYHYVVVFNIAIKIS